MDTLIKETVLKVKIVLKKKKKEKQSAVGIQ